MNKQYLMSILRAPHDTEKTSRCLENQQYVFKVLPTSTKYEIKQAVELMFDVKVDAVTTINVKGKTRRFARTLGRLKSYKKAYVTLKEGEINILGGKAGDAPV